MFERFTDRARRVVVLAQEEARALDHGYIGTEHLLLGLVTEEEGVGARALASFGLTKEVVREEVLGLVGRGSSTPTGNIPFTPRAKRLLELSLREALRLNHNDIGTEHLLLGLLRQGEGVACTVLEARGLQAEAVGDKVLDLLGAPVPQPGAAREAGKAVVRFLSTPATPAAQHALDSLEQLVRGRPVTSLDLLLALLAQQDSAATRALGAAGVDLDLVRTALQDAEVAGTADELPQEAGVRGMTLRLTDDAFSLEVTDPRLLQQARDTFAELGDSALAGSDARAASLAEVWLALAASLAGIRSNLRTGQEPLPPA